MQKDAKEYMNSVVEILMVKYHMTELESYKLVKNSFLYDSLLNFPEETMHDDIETNADIVFHNTTDSKLLKM